MSHEPVSPESRWPALQRADAERVLRRAAEIEALGGEWVDGDELRKAAAAAELDPRSVERALAEVAPGGEPRPAPKPLPAKYLSVLCGLVLALVLAVAGRVIGVLGAWTWADRLEIAAQAVLFLGAIGWLAGGLAGVARTLVRERS
jgi:hypothetical protein